MEWFLDLNAVTQALIATLFTWAITALGASSVFLFKKINQKILDSILGCAAGVMLAASFWSLLNPAIELSVSLGYVEWFFPALGFFLGGCFADDNIELMKYLVEKGHELANHGYFHKEHSKLSESQNLLEIQNCHNIVKAHTGIEMNLFAPPSGDYNKTTIEVCEKIGYKVILWSLDTIDWRDKNEKIVYNRATQKIKGGDFVLMHPKQHTLKVLPDILNFYLQKGLVVTTVSQCMENNG